MKAHAGTDALPITDSAGRFTLTERPGGPQELVASLPAGAKVQPASLKITPGSAGGPANVVATGGATFKVMSNGQEIPFDMTLAFITGPLIEAEVSTLNVGTTPVPDSMVKPLVSTVATRASKG